MENPKTKSSRGKPRVLVGTCNWSDHEDFYPKGLKSTERLRYYARFFSIVEVDSTFYRLQSARNFARWAEMTPDDFVFNVKAYRELTFHDRIDNVPKEPDASTFESFNESVEPLRQANKLGVIHFQFPPWFRNTQENRDFILSARDFFPKDRFGVEFRHRSWLEPESADATLDFLRQAEIIFTAVDEPQLGSGSVPPVVGATNPEIAIVRFHGRNSQTWYKKTEKTSDRFNYLYSQEELAEWVEPIRELSSSARIVHALMNNNHGNYAVRNAFDIAQLLGDMAALPETSVRLFGEGGAQLSLFDTNSAASDQKEGSA